MSEREPLPPTSGFRFPKDRRIASGNDFSRIIRQGGFAADQTLIVNALPSGTAAGRLGVTIPKKTGSAVVRNRWKRLIREAYRVQQHQLPAGFDLIVRPRRGAVASFSRVQHSIGRLARRAAAGA